VVTNCRDAELLDTLTGEVLGSGMEAIPDRQKSVAMLGETEFSPFADQAKREREARILNVFDVEVCCKNGTCELPAKEETEK
jgi:hypothetical protein